MFLRRSAAPLLWLHAVDTKTWQQAEMADFEKGSLTHLSLSSDGRLTLAPVLKEIFDPSVTFLWAVARDSKGNLYRGRRRIGRIQGQAGSKWTRREKPRLWRSWMAWRSRRSPSTGRIAYMRRRRRTARCIAWTPRGKPKCFTIRKRNISGRWRFRKSGDLYVATGDQGEIHRVTPAGAGSVFFKTEETHARSLAIDANDNLIVGTDPSGLIVRIIPGGAGIRVVPGVQARDYGGRGRARWDHLRGGRRETSRLLPR